MHHDSYIAASPVAGHLNLAPSKPLPDPHRAASSQNRGSALIQVNAHVSGLPFCLEVKTIPLRAVGQSVTRDIYSKVVLTVIAVMLSVLALRSAGIPAFGQSGGVVRVVICGADANPRAAGQLACAQILTDQTGVGRLIVTR